MIILLSPAKKQDFVHTHPDCGFSIPATMKQIKQLATELKTYSSKQLANLMSISPTLAQLNYERYQAFATKRLDLNNAKQAIFAFKGDVYQKLDAATFTHEDLDYAQNHLLILSGLYGFLKPLDLIQPYRLEMKTALAFNSFKNLYAFWGELITEGINQSLNKSKNKVIVNLASNEYFKAVHPKKLTGEVITIDFKEYKNGQYKTIGIQAKRARGLMARYIIKNRIDTIAPLKSFCEADYQFHPKLSNDTHLTFSRQI